MSIDEFTKPFPPEIKKIVKRLRKIIKETVPEYKEAVYEGWGLIGYRVIDGSKSHYFGFIYPANDKVTLGFEYGSSLNDPHKVLAGKREAG